MEPVTFKKEIKSNIVQYVSSDICCGCGACSQICQLRAIRMSDGEFGFRLPVVDENICVGCGLCLKACPIIHSDENRKKPINCYAATNKLPAESFHCSSGGIFPLIAETVINDGGIVCGAAFTDEFKVKHITADSLDMLDHIKKSKYVQSDTSEIYKKVKDILNDGKPVLFSGTPCQIQGLYTYLNSTDYDKLLTVDVVCHGVPSQRLFDDYLSTIQNRNGVLDNYMFRAKRKNKNGMKWFFSFTINGKKHFRNWPEDSYNYYYMMGKINRDSCYTCPFACSDRVSDITLCDYWSWDKYHIGVFDKMDCVSGVLINTDSGQKVFDRIKSRIVFVSANLDDIVRHNSCLVEPLAKPLDRDSLLREWNEKGYSIIDQSFRKKYKTQRLKYAIMRIIPDKILNFMTRSK